MVKQIKLSCYIICIMAFHSDFLHARSVHRPIDTTLPKISVQYEHQKKRYTLQDSHLEFYPFFGIFNKDFFDENLLPDAPISYRNRLDQSVSSSILNDLIEVLLKEIHQQRYEYSDFDIITSKNFNRKKVCGMMILKFKKYPFIVKLAIETPETFINPYCKGLDNVWFFPLGGGINRHLLGFTRVKNLHTIKERLSHHAQWSTAIDLPRKWYWVPKSSEWLRISGYNIGGHEELTIKLPSTYCIIADAIETIEQFSLFNSEQTTLALSICNYLDLWIDPHINNFMIEKNTGKIVIVDTEHFPSVVGIKEKVAFESYTSWILYLMRKCTKDWFFRTKNERQLAQSAAYTWTEFTQLT